ncbi:MAG: radical SAM/SPASM domain-containing protein [Chloroflexi bacterium HGW-Chloroflexi-2]|jgi:radical SAM protein|nr:MAG: radical SAM/SPASM domain-containing protein [Chloroflexi bacterium HGW-Chloroflexi-2]
MKLIRRPAYDLSQRPFMVIWETTQACDLACKHCRAESQPNHHPKMLSFEDGKMLIDQVVDLGKPHPLFILTGGDPFKREDIFDLAAYASEQGLPVALSPSGTPLLNPENLIKLKNVGIKAISLSLDGSTPLIHDAFRGVEGSHDWTVNGWKTANQLGLKIQLNTTVTRYNLFDLPDIFALVHQLGVMTWSIFFLVPTGRGLVEDEIKSEDYEAVLNFIYDASKYVRLKTTEGHHYKRVVLQRSYLDRNHLNPGDYMNLNGTYTRLREGLEAHIQNLAQSAETHENMRRAPMHVNAGDGFVFISLLGEVFPSGYLPVSAGNVKDRPLKDIYQQSKLFLALRNKDVLKGRCGKCEYRFVCGGSRSRAFAMTGDYLAEEPFCSYEPGSFPFAEALIEMVD